MTYAPRLTIDEHKANVAHFERVNGRLPGNSRPAGAHRRQEPPRATRQKADIPDHWAAQPPNPEELVREVADWVSAHNGLWPRGRSMTIEGALRSRLESWRRAESMSDAQRALLNTQLPGWDAETLDTGAAIKVKPDIPRFASRGNKLVHPRLTKSQRAGVL